MSRTTIYNALAATGIPCAHMCFPTENAPSLPFCVFYTDEDRSQYADDTRYASNPVWTVELYEDHADEVNEAKIEDALSALAPWTRTEAWNEDDNCLVVIYMIRSMKG